MCVAPVVSITAPFHLSWAAEHVEVEAMAMVTTSPTRWRTRILVPHARASITLLLPRSSYSCHARAVVGAAAFHSFEMAPTLPVSATQPATKTPEALRVGY